MSESGVRASAHALSQLHVHACRPELASTERKKPKEPKEVTNRKVKRDRNSDIDEEKELEESIEFILKMEDPNYKEPEPCIGLTCPLTGEQYYVD